MSLVPRSRSRRGGCLAKILVAMCLMAGLAVLCWITLLPLVVTKVIHNRTGFDVAIQDLTVNPFTARFSLKGLVVGNPSSYPISDFVQVREFTADAELASLWGDQLVVEEAVVDIGRLALVKNSKGERNVMAFYQSLVGEQPPASEARKAEEAPKQEGPAKEFKFLIRKMHLRLDRIVIADGLGANPDVKTIDIQFSQDYENVSTVTQITTPIVKQALLRSGDIKDFATKAFEGFKGENLKDLGKKAGDTLKGLFQSLGEKGGK